MIEILLKDIKPVSVNAAYATARNGGRFNTKKYSEFLRNFKIAMFPHNGLLTEFDRSFDHNKQEIMLEFTFYLPKKRYYTTQRKVSLRSGDASNFIKTTEYALFKMLHTIDDAQVKKVSSEKKVSHDNNCHIGIKIYTVLFEISA